MMLADAGASVLRIVRPAEPRDSRPADHDIVSRGTTALTLDLKSPTHRQLVLRLVSRSDAIIEGFRPGVMERLGLGPAECQDVNPRLVYGRVTGWGQTGPLSQSAGHDLNYIALSGALAAIGPLDRPVPPLNLVGDYAGGAMMLAFGLMCALLEAARSGKGQVVDASMSDGAATLMSVFYAMKASGRWTESRESNHIDGGAPYYRTYQCKDGKWISIAAIEPKFYDLLLGLLKVDPKHFHPQLDRNSWPERRRRLTEIFAEKTRADWEAVFSGSDACFAPVLDMSEAALHPHNAARGTFYEDQGVLQPSPSPRFSRSQPERQDESELSERKLGVLSEFGLSPAEAFALL